MSTDGLLPVPDWAKSADISNMMDTLLEEDSVPFKPLELERVTNYSTFFAEWVLKQGTALVHLFPRRGPDDSWDDGRYVEVCRACKASVSHDVAANRKPCPRCGKVGLLYIPGRVEERTKVFFPKDVLSRIKRAVDSVWMGKVAFEVVQELGAVAVQFQGIDDEIIPLLGRFFDAFDKEIDDAQETAH